VEVRRLSDPADLPVAGIRSGHRRRLSRRGARGARRGGRKLAARAAVLVCDHADPVDARAWAQFAQRARIRLLGPGTMGFVRPSLGLNAGRMGPMPKDGNLALVSQSGVLNGAILDWAGGTVLGFSLAVSLGAEADVDLAQVLDYLANDPHARARWWCTWKRCASRAAS
jgi:acetyltransferase